MARPEKCLDLSFLNVFRGILVLLKTGTFSGNLRFVVFLTTPGGELNRKLIRLDFEVTQWLHRRFVKYNLIRWQKLSGVGKGTVTRNVPNSTDFVASYKIYTVFNVSGCFKFIVTFHKVFLVLISILI